MNRPNQQGQLIGCITAVASIFVSCCAYAAEDPIELAPIEVIGRADDMAGIAGSATEGLVGRKQVLSRPLSRTGEALETVPGVIATQHSGSGKANQYFLRGFNLDHGTDLATFVAGMPVNLPTHAHGQGYTDLSFMIPELIEGINYRKGPYYASVGDFSAAGSAHIEYVGKLDRGLAQFTAGSFGFYRGLLAGSQAMARGQVLGAFEVLQYDGPWRNDEDARRYNGVLRYSQGDKQNGVNLTAMAYHGDWNSTDQIPRRAIASGALSRFGAVDPSDGGESHRYSISGEWRRGSKSSTSQVGAYFIDYSLNLFSNFTYFLDDPVNGDQFEQEDRRQIYGFQAQHTFFSRPWGMTMENEVGLQLRFDDIGRVGLFHTVRRQRIGVTRSDQVGQLSVSPYFENRTQWLAKFRTVFGLRGDYYHFNVDAGDPRNAGTTADGLASPKLALIFGPWAQTEFYVNLGYGFHSNDARGATITRDPKTGVPVNAVEPLVRAKGVDLGLRTNLIPKLNSSVSFWLLDLDSELLFIGDAGTTEASRPSRRYGVEWANYYTPIPWLVVDADFAFSHARFRDDDSSGDRIPGAISMAITAGITVPDYHGFFGSLRVRHFGSRPLIEDNSVRSKATTLVNLEIGRRFAKGVRMSVGVFNLLDSRASDIDYFYTSRLAGEAADGVADIHTHPVEPRAFRGTISLSF